VTGLGGEGGGEEKPVELDPYEVEAIRVESAEDLMTAGLDWVDPEGTGRQTAGSLGEALSWEPGVSSTFYGAGASRPIVRGMGGYRVGVYDSGLSTGDLSASSPDHAVAIEPLFVREIILHRGAAALLHGGEAIGGAVDTVPDFLPAKETPAGGDAETGALYETVHEGRTTYLKGGYRNGGWAFRLNLLERETGDYDIPGLARTASYDRNNRVRLPPSVRGQVAPNPEGTVPNTSTRTRVAALGTGWIGETATTQATYQVYTSRYGVPLDGHTHGNPFGNPGTNGPSPNDGILIDLRQERGLARSSLKVALGPVKRIEFKGALTQFRQQEKEGRFLSNDFQLDGTDLQIEFDGEWSRGRFFAGAEWASNEYKNRNIRYNAGRADEDTLGTRADSAAAFALLEWDASPPLLRLGGRIDRQRVLRTDLNGISRTDYAGSAVAESEFPIGGSWRAVFSLARTTRIPSADELYIEAPHGATGVFQLPNPSLDPEHADSAEIRIQRDGTHFQFSASAFYREFQGYIFLENRGYEVDGLTAYSLVQREAKFRGGEIDFSWIFLTEPDRTGRLRVFADYVHASDKDRDEPLPRIPPMRTGASLEFSTGRWTTEWSALHSFEQDRVPREVFGTLAYQSPSAAYTLVSLRVERRFAFRQMDWIAGVKVSNLLNEEARQHTSFLKDVAPLPGRSLQCSLRLEF